MLRCGALNSPETQEAIAVLPGKYPPAKDGGLAILRMVILRRMPSGWQTALTVSKDIQNDAGYIGIDYIDDYSPFYGYWLVLSDKDSYGKTALDVYLTYIDAADGTTESIGTDIAWNPVVGRYQEFVMNQDPEGFRPEIKNPPHWKPGVKLPSAQPR